MRIELLMPSRGRPGAVMAAVSLAMRTAERPERVWVAVRLDDDDPADYAGIYWVDGRGEDHVRLEFGPPVEHLSAYWTELALGSEADVMQLAADDTRLRTPGWDLEVEEAFSGSPYRLAYGRDPIHGHGLATHPFFSREWVEALGYVTWPRFGRDYADTWMHQVAGACGVLRPLEMEVDHEHWLLDRSRMDDTYQRRLHMSEAAAAEWARTGLRRAADVAKLRRAIRESNQ